MQTKSSELGASANVHPRVRRLSDRDLFPTPLLRIRRSESHSSPLSRLGRSTQFGHRHPGHSYAATDQGKLQRSQSEQSAKPKRGATNSHTKQREGETQTPATVRIRRWYFPRLFLLDKKGRTSRIQSPGGESVWRLPPERSAPVRSYILEPLFR